MKRLSYKVHLDGLTPSEGHVGHDELTARMVEGSQEGVGESTCEMWLKAMALASVAANWFVLGEDELARIIVTYDRRGVRWAAYKLVHPDYTGSRVHRAPLARLQRLQDRYDLQLDQSDLEDD